MDKTEFVRQQSSGPSSQSVTCADAVASEAVYRNTILESEILEATQQSRGSGVYNSLPDLSSGPINSAHNPPSDLNSPYRSISAPARSISVDKSSNYLSRQSDVNAALSAADASALQMEQPSGHQDTTK
eukprot:IDg22669t1